MSDKALISIVDDDETTRQAVASLVRSLGYDVAVFDSAADFLNSSRLAQTACLIADVRMPEMTGPELHRHLAASGNPIPTVLITAYPEDATHARALKAGVRCCLAKPVQPDELLACIRSAIGHGTGPGTSNREPPTGNHQPPGSHNDE